jgi:MFS family permease
MSNFRKDKRPHDDEDRNKPQRPISSSESTVASKKIRTSAWITLAVLGCTLLVTFYGETMLLPAIRDIIGDFHISYSTSSWILTAYLISGAVATPIAGKLSDIYGRKKMVLVIFIIYIIGICIGGLSNNITSLIVARVIQGIGISMFPIAFGIIRDQLPKEKLAIGVGVFSSMFAAGSVIGLAVGGIIVKSFGWHTTFLSIVPAAIILWVVISRVIRDSRDKSDISDNEEAEDTNNSWKHPNIANNTKNIDIKGAVALAVTIASFLLALTYVGNNNHLDSFAQITVALLAILSAGSLASFIIVERKAASPLIELSLMTQKVLLPANIILLILGITMFMVYQTAPILVRSPQPLGFGGDAVTTAMVQLPFMIVILIFAPSSGFIVSKIGNLKPTVAGTIIMTIGFFSLFMFHSTEFIVAINLAIVAAGISLIQVGAFNVTMEYTPLQFSGVSLGMSVVLFLIGSSVGPAIAGIYMQTHQEIAKGVNGGGGSFPSPLSYDLIFLTAAAISVLSVLLVIILRKRITQSDSESKLRIETSNEKENMK